MAFRRHVKNFVKNYSEAEIKVREATSNDPWGPSSSLMLEISDLTYNMVSLSEIMSMIWHRMNDHGKNWRHVYKSLTLLDYLLKNGSKKVIQLCQEGFFNIHVLQDFQHLDDAGKDQGFHVREKAKQVLALLKDEQLLHNEREIARRTRRRTSYGMLFPSKPSTKGHLPTMPASESISEYPPSDVQHLPLKAPTAAEQSQPAQTSGKTEIVQERTALNMAAKKSSEDLIVFSEDESPPPPSAQSTFSAKASREELATDTALSPSERNALPMQKWDFGRKLKSAIFSRAMLKSPPRRQSSIQTQICGTALYDIWSSGPEEVIATNKQQVPTLDVPSCHIGASVETIYKSPTFQAFDPLADNTMNTKSAPPSVHFSGPSETSLQNVHYLIPGTGQTADLSSHPTRPDSTSSVGTRSSFSTFSPESAVPNNTPQPQCVLPHGSPHLSSPQGLSSLFYKDLKERIAHSFSPCPASDEDYNLTILSPHLDNIDRFTSRTFRASGESWENNTVHETPSAPASETPPDVNILEEDLLCMSVEPKCIGILEEIKNEVCGLRGDFCNAAQELHIISSELTNIVASVQNMNQFIVALQTDKYESVKQ
ncbi:ENTH domain-containing protein 1 [Sceloporus undulatus]|uniref:ENTH domain-containing protein 1 n=1 Tax=Sceloporus undulatus TaxID=8520 RepID=UPI001C4B7672|nr:ENTH domain-containing protein 1 [Sceloporus undulatus]